MKIITTTEKITILKNGLVVDERKKVFKLDRIVCVQLYRRLKRNI